jgi:hypothetical protein
MVQDIKPSEIRPDQRVPPEREPHRDSRSTTRTSQQSGQPILNDGPELLRSNHC